MKKKVLAFSTLVIVALVLGMGYLKMGTKIHNRITEYKEKCKRTAEYDMMHKDVERIAALPDVSIQGDEWFCNRPVISHSGGGILGYCYTNSKEAWEYSYACGNRVFDADCLFTTDSMMVLRHSWHDNFEQGELLMSASRIWLDRNGQARFDLPSDNCLDYHTCMSTKIHKYFTQQDCKDMIRFMQSHPDVYVATDMKEGEVLKGYKYLVDMATRIDTTNVLDRIVVSLYNYEEFDKIKAIYPFKHFSIRQYINHPHNYLELAEFCLKNDIKAVQLSLCYVNDEGVKALIDKGFKIYVAVVDYPVQFDKYRERGIYGCVSNWLHQSDLNN